ELGLQRGDAHLVAAPALVIADRVSKVVVRAHAGSPSPPPFADHSHSPGPSVRLPVYSACPTIAASTPGIAARRSRSARRATPPEAITATPRPVTPASASKLGEVSVPSRPMAV